MINDRMSKINELIKDELSLIIHDFFPGDFFSITQVRTSKDLGVTRIWVASFNTDSDFIKELTLKKNLLRKELAKKLVLRKVPALSFVLDSSEIKANKIDQILDKIKNEKV